MAGNAPPDAAERSETLPAETPPGPDGWPLVGNVPEFVRDPDAFYEELTSYGDLVSYELAGLRFCTVLHPELVEQVLVTDSERYRKWRFEEFGVDFAPEGVLQTEGEQWRRQRLVLQEAFRPDRIREYADAMIEAAEDLLDGWADGEEVPLNREFSRLTLRILARTLFDLDVDGRDDRVTSFSRTLQERADPQNLSTLLPGWVPTPANRRYDRELDRFRTFVDSLVEERRADGGGTAGGTDGGGGDDLLSLLLDAETDSGAGLSDEEIRDQLVTFLFAGHDTTSLALAYTFLLLSTHDDARRKLDTEHERVLGGEPPTLADLDDLTYTDRVIKESLRLYPPAYILFREVEADVELGGYRIPAGTKLTLPQFRIHTDERWYDDPESFRPDRWADRADDRRESAERASGEGRPASREDELPEYAYFPFGGGPRHCIGMRFATQELKLLVPTVAQRVDFDLLSDPDPDVALAATMQPREDVVARVSFE